MQDRTVPEENTEEKILDAAFDVVQEKTISGTRMALIAERAGLFQSNIHYYYKSKHELMLAVERRVLAHSIELRRTLAARSGASVPERLGVFWGQKKIFIEQEKKYDYAQIDFWVQARVDEDIRREFVASFRNWRQELIEMLCACGVEEGRAQLLAGVMTSMMEGASLQYLIDPDAFDLDAYFDCCTQMMLREIGHD